MPILLRDHPVYSELSFVHFINLPGEPRDNLSVEIDSGIETNAPSQNQVYEIYNGRSWQVIPNSRYTITRKVRRAGSKVHLEITKSGAGTSRTNPTSI